MNRELARTIGENVKRARKALQLTQEDVAERIDASITHYGNIERGTALPSVLKFARLSSALGISADALLGKPVEHVALELRRARARNRDLMAQVTKHVTLGCPRGACGHSANDHEGLTGTHCGHVSDDYLECPCGTSDAMDDRARWALEGRGWHMDDDERRARGLPLLAE